MTDAGIESRAQPLPDVVCFATQGTGHGEEERIKVLLEEVDAEVLPFDRRHKVRSGMRLLRTLLSMRPDLVVMEGTGVAGGLAVITARLVARVPFVVSSGDAVGPFVKLTHPHLAPFASLYERLLCRLSAGYIGWTPYLVGRALSFGAPRGMTAASWSAAPRREDRERRRAELGVPPDGIVFGLIGSLDWVDGIDYCYGLELVTAVLHTRRVDIYVVVYGDGSGLERLRATAGEELGRRVFLPGRVPKDLVMSHLSAFDVASLPQSVDNVGSFRYTTKLSEYLSAGLPVVTAQIPLAYDLDDGWIWRLSGTAPWDPSYIADLADLMQHLSPSDIAAKGDAVPKENPLFNRRMQQTRAARFVTDVVFRAS